MIFFFRIKLFLSFAHQLIYTLLFIQSFPKLTGNSHIIHILIIGARLAFCQNRISCHTSCWCQVSLLNLARLWIVRHVSLYRLSIQTASSIIKLCGIFHSLHALFCQSFGLLHSGIYKSAHGSFLHCRRLPRFLL